jgi:hypothetical protein
MGSERLPATEEGPMRVSIIPYLATARWALLAAALLSASPAAAQLVPAPGELPPIETHAQKMPVDSRSIEGSTHSLLGETVTRVLKDPTTYALPPIVYTAHRLDWDSSQKLFAHGSLEANPKPASVASCATAPPRSGDRR